MPTQPYLLGFSFCLSLGGHTVVRVNKALAPLLRNTLLHRLVLLLPMRFLACQQKQYLALETNTMLRNATQCYAMLCNAMWSQLRSEGMRAIPSRLVANVASTFSEDTAAALIAASFVTGSNRNRPDLCSPIPDPRSPPKLIDFFLPFFFRLHFWSPIFLFFSPASIFSRYANSLNRSLRSSLNVICKCERQIGRQSLR